MIGYIKGKVLAVEDSTLLLENNGIGYEITCSSEAIATLTGAGEGAVYTYMAVREDAVSLYGFISQEEKKAFLSLITVSGVGPKMGITILSGMKLNELLYAIATEDVKALSKVKGLGKKTAERIILELREKVGEVEKPTATKGKAVPQKKLSEESEDAIIALMSLGFTKAECMTAVEKAEENGRVGVEEIIAYAIKHVK